MKHLKQVALLSTATIAVAGIAFAAKPAPPGVVRSNRVSATQIMLKWKDRSDNETGFEVQRQRSGGGFWRTRGFTNANDNEFVDGLSRGTVYQYRVFAHGETERSRPSNRCFVNRTPPSAPVGLRPVILGVSRVRLTWADMSQGETGFAVQRRELGRGFRTIARLPEGTTEYFDEGFHPATLYTYRVRALGKPTRCVKHSKWTDERIVNITDTKALVVTMSGSGRGQIVSEPGTIRCARQRKNCDEVYTFGRTVTLRATPNPNARFKGWTGVPGCSDDLGTCTFEMSRDRQVGAIFKKLPSR